MAKETPNSNLNIRNFPTDLRKGLKVRALTRDLDLRDLVIEYLRYGLDHDMDTKPTRVSEPRAAKLRKQP
jgi:plasmid stability protein